MGKKIVLWLIFALFVMLLVWGAVNRTVAKSGTGSRQEVFFEDPEGGRRQGDYKERDQESRRGEVRAEPKPNGHKWVVDTGTIAVVNAEGMMVDTENYKDIKVSRRAWRFAQELGYRPEEGNIVTLEGFL
ncbi:MAG: hypothetical protein R6U51_03120 [Anaerolineales bacterium]